MSDPLRILVTGAAGQIAYSLMYNVAKGNVFGENQPVILVLLDIPMMADALDGVEMELEDCNLPLLVEVVKSVNPEEAFNNVDVAMLVGAMPRREGMERKDLLAANVTIFKEQGMCIEKYAKPDIKVVVVGNPANTNAFICAQYAPKVPRENFSALTRLDQNRAQAQIARKIGKGVTSMNVKNVIIWGNHSSTQFPDARYAEVTIKDTKQSAYECVQDDSWLKNDFVKIVQQRGAAVIKARKLSSAVSAANATVDHVRDWWNEDPDPTRMVSMAVVSDGSYGIPEGLVYSFPVRVNKKRGYEIVKDLPIDDFQREMMDLSMKELMEERDMALQACHDKK